MSEIGLDRKVGHNRERDIHPVCQTRDIMIEVGKPLGFLTLNRHQTCLQFGRRSGVMRSSNVSLGPLGSRE